MLEVFIEKFIWPLLDAFEFIDGKSASCRLRALEEFEKRYWWVQISVHHRVGLYYIQYVREMVPVCRVWRNRKYALEHYRECIGRSDITDLRCRRLTVFEDSCSIDYLYQRKWTEEDYRTLNPNISNVVLALAWFYENYGTEHEVKVPRKEIDKGLFSILLSRGVFDEGREPIEYENLVYDGVDYLWEGWELARALRELGVEPIVKGWIYFPGDINPFANRKVKDEEWSLSHHYEMIEHFLRHNHNIVKRMPIGNFDIWRVGISSGSFDSVLGLGYVENVKSKRGEKLIEWYRPSSPG